MYLTVESIIEELNNNDGNSLKEIANYIKRGSFMGATGNSGVILSQFFGGFSNSINKFENVGPEEIFTKELFDRVEGGKDKINEVIIATNPTMEGDATAMYLAKKIKEKGNNIKISRLGMGIPTGADLEYADDTTLFEALEGRRSMD